MPVINPSRVLHTTGTAPKLMFNGVYPASVVNINDPANLGRVQLKVPQVLGTAISNWASPLGYNVSNIPAAGTAVHVMFAGGDINHPVYFSGSGLPETLIFPTGDTTGNKDYTNIKNALSAATPIVRLTKGLYYINKAISIPNNASFTGFPASVNTSPSAVHVMPAIIKLVNGSNDHMISIAGNNVYISDIELDGNKAGQSSGFGSGILYLNQYFAIVERCFIHDQYYRGINCATGNGAKFVNCSVTGCNDAGVYMDSASNDNHVTGCLIAGHGSDGLFSAGYVNHIKDNDIWGNTNNGVKIAGGRGTLLYGNGIDHNQQHGLVITAASGSMGDVTVSSNTFHSNGLLTNNVYNSVTVDNSSGNVDGITVSDNTFWLDGGVTNKVAYHIQYGGTVVTKTHGNQFQTGSFVTGTINAASMVKDANETG